MQGELARCGGDQGRRRHLPTARAATSRNIFVHTMALALGTFLGDAQPATDHGEPRGFLKVGWCCGMYIFQSVSGAPYRHWQAMPAVARGSIETRLCPPLFLVREWYRATNKHTVSTSPAASYPCKRTRVRLHATNCKRTRASELDHLRLFFLCAVRLAARRPARPPATRMPAPGTRRWSRGTTMRPMPCSTRNKMLRCCVVSTRTDAALRFLHDRV